LLTADSDFLFCVPKTVATAMEMEMEMAGGATLGGDSLLVKHKAGSRCDLSFPSLQHNLDNVIDHNLRR
jgi:hypothetical protein